jgi:hypothetical protein
MTLIIGFGNSQHFAMVGDRRFTNWDGSGFTDENVKVGSFTCLNARLAVAFAGLARGPGFETATWILDTLLEVAKPDYDAENTLQRFCESATRDFGRLTIDKRYRRTTFLFGGFYGNTPPRPCFARISNYEYENGSTLAVASEKFTMFKLIQARLSDKEPTLMVTGGNPAGLNLAHVGELNVMLEERKPAKAMVDKAVAVIREAADDFRSGGGVGKQISTVVIPSDLGQPVGSDYDTAVPTDKVFMVNGVVALPGQNVAFRDVVLEKVSDGPNPYRPMLVPRNSPCTCGSGKRYKRCHGAPPRRTGRKKKAAKQKWA